MSLDSRGNSKLQSPHLKYRLEKDKDRIFKNIDQEQAFVRNLLEIGEKKGHLQLKSKVYISKKIREEAKNERFSRRLLRLRMNRNAKEEANDWIKSPEMKAEDLGKRFFSPHK